MLGKGGAIGVCEASADTIGNRLNTSMRGFSGDGRMEQFAERVMAEARKLRPGVAPMRELPFAFISRMVRSSAKAGPGRAREDATAAHQPADSET